MLEQVFILTTECSHSRGKLHVLGFPSFGSGVYEYAPTYEQILENTSDPEIAFMSSSLTPTNILPSSLETLIVTPTIFHPTPSHGLACAAVHRACV